MKLSLFIKVKAKLKPLVRLLRRNFTRNRIKPETISMTESTCNDGKKITPNATVTTSDVNI